MTFNYKCEVLQISILGLIHLILGYFVNNLLRYNSQAIEITHESEQSNVIFSYLQRFL